MDRVVHNKNILFGLVCLQIEEQQEKLRNAQTELEECQRKISVLLEHRDMVSQQLDHAMVGL